MLKFSPATPNQTDCSSFTVKQLYQTLQKPEALSYEAVLKELFVRRGDDACFYQEKWISACLNDRAKGLRLTFAPLPGDRKDWQILLMAALQDEKASHTHQLLCLLLTNHLFPDNKKEDIQPLVKNIVAHFQKGIPQLEQTLYLKAFASEFSLDQIRAMLTLRNHLTNPSVNIKAKVVREQAVLGPFASRLSKEELDESFQSIPPVSEWGTQLNRYADRVEGLASYLSQDQVSAFLASIKGKTEGANLGLLCAIGSRLRDDQIERFLPGLLQEVETRSDSNRDGFLGTLAQFAPSMNRDQKARVMQKFCAIANEKLSQNKRLAGNAELFIQILSAVAPELAEMALEDLKDPSRFKPINNAQGEDDDEYFEDTHEMPAHERELMFLRSTLFNVLENPESSPDLVKDAASLALALAPSLTEGELLHCLKLLKNTRSDNYLRAIPYLVSLQEPNPNAIRNHAESVYWALNDTDPVKRKTGLQIALILENYLNEEQIAAMIKPIDDKQYLAHAILNFHRNVMRKIQAPAVVENEVGEKSELINCFVM